MFTHFFTSRRKRDVIILIVLQLFILLVFSISFLAWKNGNSHVTLSPIIRHSGSDRMVLIRNRDYSLVRPLRLVDIEYEARALQSLKRDLQDHINHAKAKGELTDASVYYRDLNTGNWMCIGEGQHFQTGSLANIPLMISFLHMAEEQPGLLDKKIRYVDNYGPATEKSRPDGSLIPCRSYSIRQLIQEMIVHTDPSAMAVLLENLRDHASYDKVFADLGLPVPEPLDDSHGLTSPECSRFLRVLYNANLLNEEHSQFALGLLAGQSNREGLAATLPKDILVAHKQGEAVHKDYQEISETGIVYRDNRPYLITVMTKGPDSERLTKVIGEISSLVYFKTAE